MIGMILLDMTARIAIMAIIATPVRIAAIIILIGILDSICGHAT